jgi:hypothetical protein
MVGHVRRMENNAMPKRMLKGRLYSKEEKEDPGCVGWTMLRVI